MVRFAQTAVLCAFPALSLAQQPAPDSPSVAAGKRLYNNICQACHGGNAAGGDRAPALANNTLQHGATDAEIARNIRTGIPGTQMPPFGGLTQEEIGQLVNYIRSVDAPAAPPPPPPVAKAPTPAPPPGDTAAGEAIFFGKGGCTNCHQVNGRGAIIAPDLSNAGRLTAQAIQQKILDPNATNAGGRGGPAPPTTVIAKTKTGQELRGVRRSEDSYGLVMIDTLGKLQRLDKRTLAGVRVEQKSLMPADFKTRLAEPEIQNLVAYLRTLNGRDLAKTAQVEIPGGLPFERIRNAAAEPHNWLTYWGDYQGRHYSALKEINTSNVKQLQARWAMQMPGDSVLEATPLVLDGILYTSGQPGQVYAIDAKTGLLIWRYQRPLKIVKPNLSNRFNRGVAILGNRVFFGTLDAHLVALDARNGQPLWEVQTADVMQGYSMTVAPLALKDKVIVGTAGGEYGIRGFIDAYDAASGKRLWRFNTVPGPGEPGFETWKDDSWKQGAAATWLTGSYDAESDTLYWTVGNPGPDIDAEVRKGDNLYSCSVVALDPSTGKLKWHYQFTPGDSHDWDANQDVILVDRSFRGQSRKLLLQANRNGMFYVLDRTTGKLLSGKPFVRQTWNTGFDENGRPKVVPGSESTPQGSVVYPALGGGTNFQAPSYNPDTGWVYVATQESGQRYVRTPAAYEPGNLYMGGSAQGLGEPAVANIKAIDLETGDIKWTYPITRGSLSAGVLATAGNLLLASTAEGNLLALNAKTGAPLWRYQTGAAITASPMSYAVDGRQFIAVSAAGVLYSFALPE